MAFSSFIKTATGNLPSSGTHHHHWQTDVCQRPPILQKALYANANKTIPSLLGGGGHNGHLALVMTNAEYRVISAVTYNKPVHPGAQPVHQANANAAQITEANHLYDHTLLIQVALHVSVVNALRQQILGAVDNKYLLALKHPDLRYTVSRVKCWLTSKQHTAMLLHQETRQIEKNCATLSTPLTPTMTLKTSGCAFATHKCSLTLPRNPSKMLPQSA
jgi:hypothetical protein